MRHSLVLALGIAVLGCGRIGFDPLSAASDDAGADDGQAGVDAAVAPECALGIFSAFDDIGSGTTDDPYIICNARQYNDIGANSSSFAKSFKLGDTIDLVAVTAPHNMIGTAALPFTGDFNGDGHKVLSFKRATPLVANTGPFGSVSGATIRDVIYSNALITGANSTGGVVGSLSDSTMTGVTIQNSSVVISDFGGGGLVGFSSNSAVSNCQALDLQVTGRSSLGGLVGLAGNSQIVHSRATGIVTSTGNENEIGGLVGWAKDGTLVEDCFSSASVMSQSGVNVGGLVGHLEIGTVRRSWATGAVNNPGDGSSFGGLIGNQQGTVAQSHATGEVTGSEKVGGLVGTQTEGTISDSFATGNVKSTGGIATGGLVGRSLSAISNSYALGNVSGFNRSGGLVGANEVGDIEDCFARGTVNGAGQVGGFVGYQAPAVVTRRSYASGSVQATDTTAGGFVGDPEGNTSHCYSVGDVVAGSTATGPFSGSGTGLTDTGSYISSSSTCIGCDNNYGTAAILSSFYSFGNPPMNLATGNWNVATNWIPSANALPRLLMCGTSAFCPVEHSCVEGQCTLNP